MAVTVKDLLTAAKTAASNHQTNMDAARATSAAIAAGLPGASARAARSATAQAGTYGGTP